MSSWTGPGQPLDRAWTPGEPLDRPWIPDSLWARTCYLILHESAAKSLHFAKRQPNSASFDLDKPNINIFAPNLFFAMKNNANA